MKFHWKGLEAKTHIAMSTSRSKVSVSKYHSALKRISVSEMAKPRSETKKNKMSLEISCARSDQKEIGT